MTTAVMEHPGEGHSAPKPIVLTLNCRSAARYLRSDNDVLNTLFGIEFSRIDISIDSRFIYPTTVKRRDAEELVTLYHQYRDLSVREIDRQLRTPTALAERVRKDVEDQLYSASNSFVLTACNATRNAVRLVFINVNILEKGSVVQEAIQELFPNATFYANERDQQPKRIWLPDAVKTAADSPPRCMVCGTLMRPAGSAYVCEGCGSTSGISTA